MAVAQRMTVDEYLKIADDLPRWASLVEGEIVTHDPTLLHQEQHGLPELSLVDTVADEILVFRRSMPAAPEFDVSLELARGDKLTSPQLPGFELPLDDLFAPKPAGS
jgi:Uma2 family endonuclease